MKMKKVALQVALLTGFGLAAGAANASLSTGEMIIVHPFQWTYDNIAKECTEVLGPSGWTMIISPVLSEAFAAPAARPKPVRSAT